MKLESDGLQLSRSICRELHCDLFECVPTSELVGYLLLVDENGCFVPGNRANLIAGYYYGDVVYGIVGDALIGKEGCRNGEPDIVGLDEADFRVLENTIRSDRFYRNFFMMVLFS